MNNSTTYRRSMNGLTEINADSITTNTLAIIGGLKTNLIQSTALGQDITIEAQGAGEVLIKSNGVVIAIFDTANNLITFNNRVSQERPDGAVSYGPNCLASVTTGRGLTAFGEFALQDITTAQNATAFGYQALANANGNGNSAFGHRSLAALTTGTSNLGMGSSSGVALVSGSSNVFMGQNAGSKTTSGSFNTLIGATACNNNLTGGSWVCIGANTGHNNATLYGASSNNVCIGTSSGGGLLLSNGCTMIGHQANNTLNIGNFSNSTCIGISSVITSSNQIQLGRATEYVSAQKMSLGKTSVPANTLDVVGNMEINNGSLYFKKSTSGTQTIQWFDTLGQALGLLYASTISSAFVFEVGPPATNGFQVRTDTGNTKLRIDSTKTDFTLNQVNLKTGIALSVYNETDTNNTSIVSLATATTYNNISATGTHAFQVNSVPKLTIGDSSVSVSAVPLVVNNSNLFFKRTNTTQQIIEWFNEFDLPVCSLRPSIVSSSFVIETNTSNQPQGIELRANSDVKLRVKGTETNFIANPVGFRFGIRLNMYNETDNNITSISNLGQATNYNNESATGTHAFKINGTTKLTIGTSTIDSVIPITAPTEATGSNNTKLSTTQFVATAISNAIYILLNIGTNNWFNNNSFFGVLQTNIYPTADLDVANLLSVRTEISNTTLATTQKYVYDDFNEMNTTIGFYRWNVVGSPTGTGTIVATASKSHMGVYQISLPATNVYRSISTSGIYSGTPDEIEWIWRMTTNGTNWDCKVGISNTTLGVYTTSATFDHNQTSNAFTASINNVVVKTWTMIPIQNKWYSDKLIFSNPNITFIKTNITDNIQESFTYTGGAFGFGNLLVPRWVAQTYAGITNTFQIDYWGMRYTSNRV